MEDKSGIIQIGMKPERVLQLTEENSLSNILSLVPTEPDTCLSLIRPMETFWLPQKNLLRAKMPIPNWNSLEESADKKTHLSHITLKGTKHCLVTQRLERHGLCPNLSIQFYRE